MGDSAVAGGIAMPPQRAATLGRLRRLRLLLPEGRGLAPDRWRRRHKVILAVLWLHAAGLTIFGTVRGYGFLHCLSEGSVVALLAAVAGQPRGGQRFRSSVAAAGLMTSSALLVHFTDGLIEAHFHFFVMLALLSVYQDWIPYLLALGYVIVHHGTVGVFHSEAVYNHGDAYVHPWTWALIHGVFVLGASAANIYSWRASEEDHRRAIAEMRGNELTFRALFEQNPQPMWVFDPVTLRFLAVNEAALEHYGYSRDELLSMRVPDIAAGAPSPGELSEDGEARPGAVVHRVKGGRLIHVEAHTESLLFHGRDAGLTVVVDVSERLSLEEELRHRAFHDSLTGLANRALFQDRLAHAVERSRRRRTPVAIISIDLDDFKAVNDAHGHAPGDDVLAEVGRRVVSAARAEDTIARMGGDEFAVLLEEADPGGAADVAHRVKEALERPYIVDQAEVWVTASLGIAVQGDGGLAGDELLRRADIAAYEAKAAGKRRIEIFSTGMQSGVLRRVELAGELRRAVDRGELVLVYQPLVNLATGAVESVEALMRWRHPQRGLVPPGDFIPVAEETGLIVPMGLWALAEACRQLQEWRVSVPPARRLSVSVNVSPRQVREADFVASMVETIAACGCSPGDVILEVTEGTILHDTEQACARLGELRQAGIKVAIDDFGTGYSSIGYLGKLPLDAIKIDRMFVGGLGENGSRRRLALAVVRLVDTLDVPTVMEGVETLEELEYVRALGIDTGQGYHFSRPLDPEALAGFLLEGGGVFDGLLPDIEASGRLRERSLALPGG